ncbi:hypothetical protein B566_EDAN006798 [Ephemera danica]|nr:hypothetical protein B566_EDAN006798 [Ephemera danica]
MTASFLDYGTMRTTDNASMPVLAPTFKAMAPKPGVWSPETRRAASAKAGAYEQNLEDSGQSRTASAGDEPPPAPVWTPKSSPTLERKEFRPVRFETTSPPVRNTPPEFTRPVSPPFDLPSLEFSNSKGKASNTISSSLDRNFTLSISRLPRAQNPTVTLLQKAREGQLPRGALYLDHKMSSKETAAGSSSNGSSKPGPVGQGDIVYAVKSETVNEDKKVVELSPKKYDGIGPTTKEGIPIVLRSGIKEENYGKWYKRMYDSLHKAGRDGE